MGFLRTLFGKGIKPEKPNGQNSIDPISNNSAPDSGAKQDQALSATPTIVKNADWEFYWDGSVSEREKKARAFFAAARSAIMKEFQFASPGCLLLAYEDLGQAHYSVEVFFEQYPSSEANKPAYFVECVVKYGGPQPDRVNSYLQTTPISADKWYTKRNNSTFGIPPGCGGYRIADTFFCKKELA